VSATTGTAPASLRSGPGYWLASLRAMLRFDYGGMRQWAPMLVVIQTMMGAGMAMTYGFFYPDLTPARALFITTGAPVLALFPLGFVMVPGVVGQQRIEGTFDYIWSLPAPRSAQATSTFLLYSLLALPGTVLALAVSAWRYGVDLSVSPLIVPAALLCSLVAVTVGYGMALLIENTMVVNVISNALVFMVLLFSPIAYPIEQLPDWFASVHRVLPFFHMAVVIRAGLTDGVVSGVPGSFAVLCLWALAGTAATAWVVGRRR
jgi:ABC-2 type transport system permease protein